MTTERAKLLLVDDDNETRASVRDVLSSQFVLEVVEARGAREAIAYLQAQSFNVIVSDLQMADGDGLELLSYWEDHPDIRSYLILFTGSEVSPVIRERVTVIAKPLIHELISVLHDLGLEVADAESRSIEMK